MRLKLLDAPRESGSLDSPYPTEASSTTFRGLGEPWDQVENPLTASRFPRSLGVGVGCVESSKTHLPSNDLGFV